MEDSFEQITEIPAATEYIGEDKNAVCSALNLKTEELKEEKASVGRFLLENQMAKSIRDKTGFSTYFLFGKVNEKPDCLYGVDYEYLGDQKDENNFALLQNLLKRLTEKYGEPSTYEGLKNQITKIESAEIIKNGKVGDDFREDWSFRDKKFNTLILSVECLEDAVRIRLRYQLLLMPGEK